MTSSTTLRARGAALAATAGLALAGAVVLSTPAHAALSETGYGFQATAYGTRAQAPSVQVGLPRTAFAYISCTRLAGRTQTSSLQDQLGLPLNEANPLVKINAVKTTTRSYKDLTHGIAGASQGATTIGSVVLGGVDGGPELSFDGLKTVSTAWADRAGKLHAKNDVKALDLDLTLPTPPTTGTPLDDLYNAIHTTVGSVIDQVIGVLRDNLGGIEIPGSAPSRWAASTGTGRAARRPTPPRSCSGSTSTAWTARRAPPRTTSSSASAVPGPGSPRASARASWPVTASASGPPPARSSATSATSARASSPARARTPRCSRTGRRRPTSASRSRPW